MNSPQPHSVAVLVSGSGSLLQSILDNQDSSYQVVLVVADKQCLALERAEAAGVLTRLVEMLPDRGQWNQSLADVIAETGPDVIVSAGFMKILGPEFLACYKGRTINTHPSLLPSFPGAHAVRDALEYGVKVTGCTVHFVDSGVDTGPIIAQRAVEVAPGDDEASLHERIKVAERALIVEVLCSMSISSANGKLSF